MIKVEVCTGSIGDSITAWMAGASRLELNSGIETGGLTPSPGVVAQVMNEIEIPVVVMVRPRSGDFFYSSAEKTAILRDIDTYLGLGASGIVFGSLLESRQVDGELAGLVRKTAGSREVVFHRAFDMVPSFHEAAAVLSDAGIDRILTSGGKATAWEGRDVLRELVAGFGHSLEILPASGISSANALQLAKHTGCKWIHGSFSGFSTAQASSNIVPRGSQGTSAREIEALVKLLEDLQ